MVRVGLLIERFLNEKMFRFHVKLFKKQTFERKCFGSL